MGKIVSNGWTNYGAWQLKKYGNIIPAIESTPEDELMNSGLEELNRLAEWMSGNQQTNHLFIIDPPAVRVGTVRRKKRFDKMVIHPAIYKVNKIKR